MFICIGILLWEGGRWRQENAHKSMGQITLSVQQPMRRDSGSIKVEVEDQHPRMSPDLCMYTHGSYVSMCAHTHTHTQRERQTERIKYKTKQKQKCHQGSRKAQMGRLKF